MLILDSSSHKSHCCFSGLTGIFLLLISHCAEVLCYLQPLPVLSVSIVN